MTVPRPLLCLASCELEGCQPFHLLAPSSQRDRMELLRMSWRILINWTVAISCIHMWAARVHRDNKVLATLK